MGLTLVCTSIMLSACTDAPKTSNMSPIRAAEQAQAATALACHDFEFRSKEFTAGLSIGALSSNDPHVWDGLGSLYASIGVALYDLPYPELARDLKAERRWVWALSLDHDRLRARHKLQTDLSRLRQTQIEVDSLCTAATTQATASFPSSET
jgi:hypothetical protein